MAQLELNGVVQRYGKQTIVDGVNFQLEAGSIACLLGPSGCGKTTLLRCIAGFEEIADGEIRLRRELVSRAGQCVPPEKRRIFPAFWLRLQRFRSLGCQLSPLPWTDWIRCCRLFKCRKAYWLQR